MSKFKFKFMSLTKEQDASTHVLFLACLSARVWRCPDHNALHTSPQAKPSSKPWAPTSMAPRRVRRPAALFWGAASRLHDAHPPLIHVDRELARPQER
jgi:hypothetical protein